MKLLVTGAAGFIGANFARLAVDEGHEVVGFDSLTYAGNEENLREQLDDGTVELVVGDIADAGLVNATLDRTRPDAVVHFAAESHNDNSFLGPLRFVTTNVVGTATLLEAARAHGLRFHHISTDEVFGDLDYDTPGRFTPDTPYDPSQYYSATKAAADHLVRAAWRQFGQPVTLSNCSNNYGPFQHVEKFIPRTITEALAGRRPKLWNGGRNVRDWIHVDDHNRAVLTILERGRLGETYLVGADGERSNLDVARTVLELMGDDPDRIELTEGDRPAHDRRYAIDASKLRDELGWSPRYVDLRAGLADTVGWYRSNEAWWKPAKDATEARYAGLGR